jgi:hypothetical protein
MANRSEDSTTLMPSLNRFLDGRAGPYVSIPVKQPITMKIGISTVLDGWVVKHVYNSGYGNCRPCVFHVVTLCYRE